jgi:Co/Zn/Cd efflux system component
MAGEVVATESTRESKQVNQSLLTVLVAFLANVLIAIAKSVAAVITSSASMLAEAAHSWADAGNEIFLLIADRRSDRGRDSEHPMGFGREAYVWSMFAAFGLFTAGAVVSIWHGVQQLIEPEEASNFLVAYVVLGIAFVLEGVSFTQATFQARRMAAQLDRSVQDYISNTSRSHLARRLRRRRRGLIGITIAIIGIALHQVTGSATPGRHRLHSGWRAAGGRRRLLDRSQPTLPGRGGGTSRGSPRRSPQAPGRPDIDRITYLHLEFVGPSRLYLVASVDMAGDDVEHSLAVRLRQVERELEEHENIEEAVLTSPHPTSVSLLP